MSAEPHRTADGEADSAGARRILVVDDDRLTRDLLSTVLDLEEYELVQAADGDEALARAGEQRFDLVLLDVMMPGVNGFEVCQQLKGAVPDTRVVLLTARDTPSDRERGSVAGADAYLTKPFSPLALLDTMQRLLGSG